MGMATLNGTPIHSRRVVAAEIGRYHFVLQKEHTYM